MAGASAGLAGAIVGIAVGEGVVMMGGLASIAFFARRASRARARIVQGRAFVALQHAQAAILSGDLESAEERLSLLPKRAQPNALRSRELLRSLIAVRRGDLQGAQSFLGAVLAATPSDSLAGIQWATARGILSLTFAGAGQVDSARRTAEETIASPYALKDARLFAGLAWGVALERAGERAELRAHLERHRGELLASSGPSERRLLRAWARMLEMPAHSVYREAPVIAEEAEAAFVRAVSPEAARFADEPPRDLSKTRAVLGEAGSAALPTRVSRSMPRTVWIPGLGAIVLFVGLLGYGALHAITASAARSPSADELSALLGVSLTATLTVLLCGLLVWRSHKARAGRTAAAEIFQAFRALGAGDLAAAGTFAESAAKSGHRAYGAQAEHVLAQIAAARGKPELAIEHSERALATVAGDAQLAELLADTLVADLVTTRAFALAATGRTEAARTALEALPKSAFALSQRFTVELEIAIASNDLDRAYELASAAPPALDPMTELIVDLVRAVRAREGVGLPELLRLRREVGRAPERRHLTRYAPRLLDAFMRMEDGDARDEDMGAWGDDLDRELDAAASAELAAAHEAECSLEAELALAKANGRRVA